jgi:hypothetical protein
MKQMLVVLLLLGLSVTLVAQVPTGAVTLRGYVVDARCGAAMAGKPTGAVRAARHTKACALDEACAAAGYGVFAEGKWVKFDARGDVLAKAAIRASKKERGHYCEVRGSMRGEQFAVVSLKERTEKK